MGHFENSCRARSDSASIFENSGLNMVQLSKLLNCGYRRPEVQQIKGWRFHINSFTMYGKMNMCFIYAGVFGGYLAYKKMTAETLPTIRSTHSLVAKHVTPEKWAKLGGIQTKTSGFTLAKAIACAVEFDDQHCGIYAGDQDSYEVFADVFDPIIEEYHGLPKGFAHTSDMEVGKINGNIEENAPVHSVRIR